MSKKTQRMRPEDKPNVLGIYCRISKLKEDGKDRSIPDQKKLGIKKAKELEMEYRFYIDEGITATGDDIKDRPQMELLIEHVVSEEIKAVFVIDESRLSRNPKTKYIIIDTFKDYQVITHTLIDGILDYSDPNTEFISELKGIIHKRQITEQRIKIKSILKSNAEQGKVHGIIPYGYKKDENGYFLIDEEEAKVVKRIYELSLSGLGLNQIANLFNKEGVKTRYNKISTGTLTTKNRFTGKVRTIEKEKIQWAGNTIRTIIKNTFYYGERNFSGEIYTVPKIIEKSYWHRVNENYKSRSNSSGKRTNHLYLLSGLLKCDKCGQPMNGRVRSKQANSYYICNSKRFSHLNCGNRSMNITRLDDFVWREISVNNIIREHIINGLKNSDNENAKKDIERELKDLNSGIESFKLEKKKAVQLAIKGVISENDIQPEITSIEQKINDLQVKIANKNIELSDLNYTINNIDNIRKSFNESIDAIGFNKKQEFLKQYIKHISIRYYEINNKNKLNRFFHITFSFTIYPKPITYILDWKYRFIKFFNPMDIIINENLYKDGKVSDVNINNENPDILDDFYINPENEDGFYEDLND